MNNRAQDEEGGLCKFITATFTGRVKISRSNRISMLLKIVELKIG